ncbi:MAG: HEAT repeat domain-containing protein [candidate division WOR-3 bacterium]
MFFFGPPNIEKLKAKRNVKGLIKALTYQKNVYKRQEAARALGEIKDAQAVEPLITALKNDPDIVRAACAEALGKICDVQAVDPLIATFKHYLDSYVRNTAIKALIEIGTPAVEPPIAALRDSDKNVRERAAYALGEIGDVRAVKPLVDALKEFRDTRIVVVERRLKK